MLNPDSKLEDGTRTDKFGEVVTHIKNVHNILDRVGLDIHSLKQRMKMSPMSSPSLQRRNRSKSIDLKCLNDPKDNTSETFSADRNCQNRTKLATPLSHHRSTSANQPLSLSSRKPLPSSFGSGEAPRKVGHRELSNLKNSFRRHSQAKSKQADGQEVSMSDQEPPRSQFTPRELLELTRSPSNPRSRGIPAPRKKTSMAFDRSTIKTTSQDSSSQQNIELCESTSDLTQTHSFATQAKKKSRNRFLEARQSPKGVGRVTKDVKEVLKSSTNNVTNVTVKEITLPGEHQHISTSISFQKTAENTLTNDTSCRDNTSTKQDLLEDTGNFLYTPKERLQVQQHDKVFSPTTTGHSSSISQPMSSNENLHTKIEQPLKSTSKICYKTSNATTHSQQGSRIISPSKDANYCSESTQSIVKSSPSSKLPKPSSYVVRSPSRIPRPAFNVFHASPKKSSSLNCSPIKPPQPSKLELQSSSPTPHFSHATSDVRSGFEERLKTVQTANTPPTTVNNPTLFHGTALNSSFVNKASTILKTETAETSNNITPCSRKNRLRTKSCDDKKLSRINCSPYHKSLSKNRNYDAQCSGEGTGDRSGQTKVPNSNWLLEMTTVEQNSCDHVNDAAGHVSTDQNENEGPSEKSDSSGQQVIPIQRPTPKPRLLSPTEESNSNFPSTTQISLTVGASDNQNDATKIQNDVSKSPTVTPKASPRNLMRYTSEINKEESCYNEPPFKQDFFQADLESNSEFDEDDGQATPKNVSTLDAKCPMTNDALWCETTELHSKFIAEDECPPQELSSETSRGMKTDQTKSSNSIACNAAPVCSNLKNSENDMNIYDQHLLGVSSQSEHRWKEIEAKISNSAFTNVSSWQWMHRNDAEKVSVKSMNSKVEGKRSSIDLYPSHLTNMRTMSGASTPASITSLEVSRVLENKAASDKKKFLRCIVDSPTKPKLRSAQCSPKIKRLMSRFEDFPESLSFENLKKVKESLCDKNPVETVQSTYATFSDATIIKHHSKTQKVGTHSGMLNDIYTPNELVCINRSVSGKHSFESNSAFQYTQSSRRDSDSESFQSCSSDSTDLDSMMDCLHEPVAVACQGKTHTFDGLLSNLAFFVSKALNFCLSRLRGLRNSKVVAKTQDTFLAHLPLIASSANLSKKVKENPWITKECKLLWRQIAIESNQLLNLLIDLLPTPSHIRHVVNKLSSFGAALKEQFFQEVTIHREIMECNRSKNEVDHRYADILGQRVLEPRPASLVRLVRAYQRDTTPGSYYSRRGHKAYHYLTRFAMHTLYNVAVMMASITVLWFCCSETSADDFFYHTEFYLNNVITFTRGPGHRSIH